MIGRTNALSAAGVELSLVVSVTTGSVVTATKGSLSVSGTASGGSVTLKLPEAGTWSVRVYDGLYRHYRFLLRYADAENQRRGRKQLRRQQGGPVIENHRKLSHS